MFLLQISFWTLIATLLVTLGILFLNWLFERSNVKNVIKFKSFKSFYNINPGRWELKNNYVEFKRPNYSYYFSDYKTYYFGFGFIDYYKYKLWKHSLKKQREQIKSCKEMQEVLNIVKADIEKFNKENAANMEKQLKDLWRM